MTRPHLPDLGTVVSLGAHILDILGRPVSSIPEGQGAMLLDEIRVTAAGTAAATSVDLARLGVHVQSMGVVGDDAMGRLLLMLMEEAGVDISLMVTRAGARTSATLLPIRPNGERPALHAPGASATLSSADLTAAHRAAIQGARVLHIGGPDALATLEDGWLAETMKQARRRGTCVTVDLLQPGSTRTLQRLAGLADGMDWLLPNAEQLQRLTAKPRLDAALTAVQATLGSSIVVTLDAGGCVIAHQAQRWWLPALRTRVVDTTGCGDAFNAGFIVGLLLGCEAPISAWLANACGALVATGLGSDAGIQDMAQVLDYLAGAEPVLEARADASELSAWPVIDISPREAALEISSRLRRLSAMGGDGPAARGAWKGE